MGAVLNIKDFSRGASRPAIKKYIESNHKKIMNPAMLRKALSKAVGAGDLLQEGQRFKLPKGKRTELRKPAPKPKKKKKKTTKKKTKKKTTKKKTKKKTKKTTKKKTKKKTAKKKTKKTAKKKTTKKKAKT